jgi:hypothetical protein
MRQTSIPRQNTLSLAKSISLRFLNLLKPKPVLLILQIPLKQKPLILPRVKLLAATDWAIL